MCTLYNFSKTRLFQTDRCNVKCYLDLKREVLYNHERGRVCLHNITATYNIQVKHLMNVKLLHTVADLNPGTTTTTDSEMRQLWRMQRTH